MPSNGDPTSAGWHGSFAKYDQVSFPQLLRQQGASPVAVMLMTAGYYSDKELGDPSYYSALQWLRSGALQRNNKGSFSIKDGNDQLPRAFTVRLGDKIRFGAPAVRIEHGAERARVTYLHGGAPQTITAERLVCAIPFSLVRGIKICPALSTETKD